MKKVLAFLYKNPEIIFFICVFILWTALMCYENSKEGGDFRWHDLKVEANGMIFDLFVFGILVTLYNALRASKEKIERLQEEIEDYREWHEKEATYRIIGAIKRLNKARVNKLELRHCFFENANLTEVSLQGANLIKANFQGANLTEVNLQGANLQEAKLQNAKLHRAKLQAALLVGANLEGAILWEAELLDAKFKQTNIRQTDLEGAHVGDDWFEKLEYSGVIGIEEVKEKYQIDHNGRLRRK